MGSTSLSKVTEALQHPLGVYAHFGPSVPNQPILPYRMGLGVFSMQKLQLHSLKVYPSNHTVRCQNCLKRLENVPLACWMRDGHYEMLLESLGAVKERFGDCGSEWQTRARQETDPEAVGHV